MTVQIGYLLPTRESIMEGRPEAAPLLALAERAEALGYDSVWIGDSLLARPRHEPITMLSAVAARGASDPSHVGFQSSAPRMQLKAPRHRGQRSQGIGST